MSDEGKKKVDEDWKRRAQLEKEQDAEKAGEARAAAKPAGGGAAPPPKRRERRGNAEFLGLVESLATQALMFMGAVRDPMTGAAHQDLGQAQAMIDILEMLEEKTRGNLTPEEAEQLQGILDDLRLNYVRLSTPPGPRGPMMGNKPRP